MVSEYVPEIVVFTPPTYIAPPFPVSAMSILNLESIILAKLPSTYIAPPLLVALFLPKDDFSIVAPVPFT